MKRLILIFLVLALIVFCVACGGNSDDTNTDTSTNTDTNTNTNTDTDTDTDVTPIKFVITWLDESGNKLSSNEVTEGEVPNYSYEKNDTAEWDYTFEGWSASNNGDVLTSIPAAKENATYYAVVSKVKQKYTVLVNN